MSTSILVTRSLEDSSSIMKLTSTMAINIEGLSLIEFEAVEFEIPDTEWLYFYSKTAVKHFLAKCALSHYKVASFGQETGKYISRYAPVAFQSNADTATAIDQINRDDLASKMTFVCGEQSLRSVQKALAVKTQELIVYNQKIKEDLALSNYDIAVMTSPLNVKSFFQNGGKAERYVAIGKTTATALMGYDAAYGSGYHLNPKVAEKPSEEYLTKAIREVIGKN